MVCLGTRSSGTALVQGAERLDLRLELHFVAVRDEFANPNGVVKLRLCA